MAARVRVFLTHSPDMLANYYGERALGELRAVAEVKLNPHGRLITMPELVAAAADCQIIISDRQTPGEAAVFDSLPNLVVFERVAVDIRNIDVAAASRNGVLVTQASPGFVPAVAEWIVGAMIDAGRHVMRYTSQYRRGEDAEPIMGRQLRGATLGIIGYGAIAAHLCHIAQALGMRVLVHDPFKKVDAPLIAASKEQVFAEADFVVPLAVATPETENLIDAAALARMRRTAWLINASRGNLVDEAALAKVLSEGRIAGAAMDVGRAPDQMPSPELARLPNVIATPHIGGLTPPASESQAFDTVRQVEALVKGEVPPGAANLKDWSRRSALS